jgi:hypothetical protein
MSSSDIGPASVVGAPQWAPPSGDEMNPTSIWHVASVQTALR